MNWTFTESKFIYGRKKVTRRKAVCNTLLGEFKVYESVGGRVFIIHPFVYRAGGMPGYNPDPQNEFSTPKILVESFEDGLNYLELKWQHVKDAVNKT